jgi:hypothetical protein
MDILGLAFGTVLLIKTQFNFINFIIKQLRLIGDRVVYSVWLADQLQLYENKILVKIISITLEMIFSHTRVLFYIILSSKK